MIIRNAECELELTNTDAPNVFDNYVVFTGNAVSTITLDGVFVQRDVDGVGSRHLFAK